LLFIVGISLTPQFQGEGKVDHAHATLAWLPTALLGAQGLLALITRFSKEHKRRSG